MCAFFIQTICTVCTTPGFPRGCKRPPYSAFHNDYPPPTLQQRVNLGCHAPHPREGGEGGAILEPPIVYKPSPYDCACYKVIGHRFFVGCRTNENCMGPYLLTKDLNKQYKCKCLELISVCLSFSDPYATTRTIVCGKFNRKSVRI